MRPYETRTRRFTRRLWIERAVFSTVIVILIAVQILGALAGRRGVICVNGDEVAVLKSPSAARSVIDQVRERLAPGHAGTAQFVQDVRIAVEKLPKERVMTPEVAKAKLLTAVEVGAKLWAISVNGRPILALDTREEAAKTLALYVSECSGEEVGPEVAPTRIAEQVEITQRLVPLASRASSAEAACARLLEGKSKQASHLVTEGETGYEIAHHYGLGYYRLRELNPGKNLDHLQIGDKLVVSDSEPVITVIATRRAALSESIDYPVRIVRSSSLYKDQQVTKQQGRLGRRTVEAVVTLVNGQIMDRQILESSIERSPIAQVVHVGTRNRPRYRHFNFGGAMLAGGSMRGESAARRIYLMYRRGNQRGHFRGVYGMKELGVDVATAHSLNHAFGAHYVYGMSWDTVKRYLDRGDRSFGGRWGCAGGPHDPHGAASWIRRNMGG